MLVPEDYVCDGVYNTVQDNDINSPICMHDHMVAMLPKVCFILADVSQV